MFTRIVQDDSGKWIAKSYDGRNLSDDDVDDTHSWEEIEALKRARYDAEVAEIRRQYDAGLLTGKPYTLHADASLNPGRVRIHAGHDDE